MVSPIKPTPVLRGKDAIRFVEQMLREQENPNPARIRLIREAKKTNFNIKY